MQKSNLLECFVVSLCLFQGPRRGSHADQGHWNSKSWEENPGIFHGDRLHFRRVLPGHPSLHLLHFCLDQSKYPGILLVHEGENTYIKSKDWSNFKKPKIILVLLFCSEIQMQIILISIWCWWWYLNHWWCWLNWC